MIVFKAIARRPVDWADIENLLMTNAQIDHLHIIGWLSEFADTLEDPTMLTAYRKFAEKKRRIS